MDPDAPDLIEAAVARFAARHPAPHPAASIVVVIAAFDEAASVAGVVGSVPGSVDGHRSECIVVDDGSTDGTEARAAAAGALVCRLERNLGQGAALQVGYRLAGARGARVIVTMDADGQFDPAEIGRLVRPVLAGTADFVNGSRRLGSSQTTDLARRAGVVAYGRLLSALTGVRITDPANGFRAFRPEVPASVELRQPQYQTAELLIRAAAGGFRIVEAPVTVLARAAGQTKKGGNWRYGYRFGRVVVTTWWATRSAGRR